MSIRIELGKLKNGMSIELLTPPLTPLFFDCVKLSRNHLSKRFPWAQNALNLTDAEDFVSKEMERFSSGKSMSCVDIDNGQICAFTSFFDIKHSSKCIELAYWVASSHLRKGIMKHSLSFMLNYAFDIAKYERVQVRIEEDNHESISLVSAFGFKREGLLRKSHCIYDEFKDMVILSILKDEYSSVTPCYTL